MNWAPRAGMSWVPPEGVVLTWSFGVIDVIGAQELV